MTLARRLGALAAPAVLALTLSACGGDDGLDASGAPTDASVEEFCKTLLSSADTLSGDPSPDDAKAYAEKAIAVGTPAEFSDEARKGFELFFEAVSSFSGDDLAKLTNASAPEDVFDEDETAAVQAYVEEEIKICIDSQMPDMPDMSDMPDLSEMPELPSDLTTP